MEINKDCEDTDKWFDAEIMYNNTQPKKFKAWAEKITQCKYRIFLPNGTVTDVKRFIDVNKRVDNYEFTRYLLNRYEEGL